MTGVHSCAVHQILLCLFNTKHCCGDQSYIGLCKHNMTRPPWDSLMLELRMSIVIYSAQCIQTGRGGESMPRRQFLTWHLSQVIPILRGALKADGYVLVPSFPSWDVLQRAPQKNPQHWVLVPSGHGWLADTLFSVLLTLTFITAPQKHFPNKPHEAHLCLRLCFPGGAWSGHHLNAQNSLKN